MKLIMENWREYVNGRAVESLKEGVPVPPPVIDIQGKGSTELGYPHETGSIAYKIAKGLVTPCTSSADCFKKGHPEHTKGIDPDRPYDERWNWSWDDKIEWERTSEEYDQVKRSRYGFNTALVEFDEAGYAQKFMDWIDEYWGFIDDALHQGHAEDATRTLQSIYDHMEENDAKLAAYSKDHDSEAYWKYMWENRDPYN